MDSTVKDNERAELEPPILQGLAQAVAQVDPPLELRARVLASARSQAPAAVQSASRPVAWWLATAASLALAAGLTIYTGSFAPGLPASRPNCARRGLAPTPHNSRWSTRRGRRAARRRQWLFSQRPTSRVSISPGSSRCRRQHRPAHSGAARAAWCSTRRTCRHFPQAGRINCGS